MTKITLNDATTLTNETSFLESYNANNTLIEDASDNFLSLDGTSPNSMEADLDMNSNRILNLPVPVSAEEPLRLQDLSDFTGGGTITAGAPTNASYVTLGTNGTLSAERVLTAGSGISLTDAGAGSTLTAATSFTQTGTGATSRTATAKLQEVMSVKDFGAVGNGSTDDTAAIVAANSAANTAGKDLYFPGGSYKVTSALTPTVSWFGESFRSTSLVTSSGTANILNLTSNSLIIDNFLFSSSTTRSAGSFININAVNVTVSNFYMSAPFAGITIGGSSSAVIIENGFIANTVATTGSSIVLNAGGAIYIRNIVCDNSTGARPLTHVTVNNGGDYNISDCNFIDAASAMLVIPGGGSGVTSLRCNNVYFANSGTYGISIAPTSTGFVERSDFNQCWFSGNGTTGVNIVSGGSTLVDGIEFLDCHVFLNTTGIAIDGANAKNIGIIDCQIAQNTTGIALSSACTKIRMVGNKIGACSGFSANTTGITLSATAIDSVLISNNDLSGNTGTLTNSATGTGNKITNNIGYNPVGVTAAATMGASPTTVTAGPTPETHYVRQSATNTATIAKGGQQIATLAGATTYYTVELGPNESYVTTWVTTAPTYTKDVH